jgi:predicted outer membrane repeat protein
VLPFLKVPHDDRLFRGNTVSYIESRGGAVYVSGFTLTVSNVTCEGNRAYGPSAMGGCFSVSSATVSIDRSVFRNNSAVGISSDPGLGGAVHVISGTNPVVITNCVFEDNFVDSNGNGGALSSFVPMVLQNCTFKRNFAYDGGAIHVVVQFLIASSISSCSFENNSAASYGGAIAFVVSEGVVPFVCASLTNVVASGNSAVHGGAIHLSSVSIVVNLSVTKFLLALAHSTGLR